MKTAMFAVMVGVFILISVSSSLAQSTQSEVVTVPKSMLTPEQNAQLEAASLQNRIETYGKWVGLGREVGVAVNDALKSLTSQAVDFSKTKLGGYTMFLVAWKILGKDIIQFIVGILFFLVWVPMWIWSFRRIIRTVLQEVKPDKSKIYKTIMPEHPDYEKGWHFAVAVSLVLINCMILFL